MGLPGKLRGTLVFESLLSVGDRVSAWGAVWRVVCFVGPRAVDAMCADGALAVEADELRLIVGAEGCFTTGLPSVQLGPS
eukprot:11007010-Alexandrium_andersonii.AAC.1